MYARVALLFLGLASLACAVPMPAPLNINLGAYSPALVVGDGEISFGAAEAAGEAAEPVQEQIPVTPVTEPATPVPTTEAEPATPVPTTEAEPAALTQANTLQGMGKQRIHNL